LAAAAGSVVDIAHVLRTAVSPPDGPGQPVSTPRPPAIAYLAGAAAAAGLIYYCPPGQLALLHGSGLLPAALLLFD